MSYEETIKPFISEEDETPETPETPETTEESGTDESEGGDEEI